MKKQVCVVGAGRWGRNHIRTLHELGHLGGIVDANAETLASFARQYPETRVFQNLNEALGQSFDGYTVATPAETHYELGQLLLSHRKPVLIEKPLTLKAAEARHLASLAQRNRTPLMVGHVLLFDPAIRKIKELLQQGKIGKLQYLYSNRLNLGTVRTEENILWSFAPHDISIFQYLTEAMPLEVVSRGGAFLQPQIHDTTMTVLTYPGNIVGHIFVNWLHPFKEHRLVIVGSKGMLSFEESSGNRDLLFYEKGIDWVQGEPIRRDGPTEKIDYRRRLPLTEELAYFVDRLGGKPVEIADARSAVEVLEILEQATASLLAGREDPPSAGEREYFVHASSFVDEPVEIGAGTKIWHFTHVQSGSRIGQGCVLGQNVNVGNNVHIGHFVKIQNNVSIYEGVTLEDHVFCGPSAVFTNIRDPRSKYPQRGSEFYARTLVRQGASIGANATIVCGHTIGRHAFIGAGAVVTGDVPDYALMVGVPAKRKGWVCECGKVLPEFKDDVSCPKCALGYRLADNRLVPVA